MRVAGGGRPPGGGPPTACPPGALNQPASQVAERGGCFLEGLGVLLFIGSVCVCWGRGEGHSPWYKGDSRPRHLQGKGARDALVGQTSLFGPM